MAQAGDIYETQIIGTAPGLDAAMTVRHWKMKQTMPNESTWLEEIRDQFLALFAATQLVSNQYKWIQIKYRRVHPAPKGPYVDYIPTQVVGSNANAAASYQLAYVFSVQTDTPIARNRGRFYWPGMPTIAYFNGNYQSGFATNLMNAATNWTNRFKEGGASPFLTMVVIRDGLTGVSWWEMRNIVGRPQPGVIRSRRVWP